MSFLAHLWKHLGIHTVVFVAYEDEFQKLNISQSVSHGSVCAQNNLVHSLESEGLKEAYQFGHRDPKAIKDFSKSWRDWATRNCRY